MSKLDLQKKKKNIELIFYRAVAESRPKESKKNSGSINQSRFYNI